MIVESYGCGGVNGRGGRQGYPLRIEEAVVGEEAHRIVETHNSVTLVSESRGYVDPPPVLQEDVGHQVWSQPTKSQPYTPPEWWPS